MVHLRCECSGTVGWQAFDPESRLFLWEGPWSHGGEVEVALPPEDGRYWVYVSGVEPERGWDYARGEPFVLLEAEVADGRITRAAASRTDMRRLRARSALWAARRAVTQPFSTAARHRSLIVSMVKRDLLARYRGSFADLFWTVLNPLLLMLTYAFVFGVVLRTRFGADTSGSGYVLYFLAGMLPWLAFSEAVGRAPNLVPDYRSYVKKLVFPVEVLPINVTLSGLVTQGVALVVFLVLLVAFRGGIPASALWLPALLVPQVLFTAGLCWLLAGIGVYLRDVGQVMGLALTLWFFLTPICYPASALPSGAAAVLRWNPVWALVRAYRDVLLEGHAPGISLLWLSLGAVVTLAVGFGLFAKLRRNFADVV